MKLWLLSVKSAIEFFFFFFNLLSKLWQSKRKNRNIITIKFKILQEKKLKYYDKKDVIGQISEKLSPVP